MKASTGGGGKGKTPPCPRVVQKVAEDKNLFYELSWTEQKRR